MKEEVYKVGIGDLVRFKLDHRTYLIAGHDEQRARTKYPYKFEVGIVVPGPCRTRAYVWFPSRPQPVSYLADALEVINESR